MILLDGRVVGNHKRVPFCRFGVGAKRGIAQAFGILEDGRLLVEALMGLGHILKRERFALSLIPLICVGSVFTREVGSWKDIISMEIFTSYYRFEAYETEGLQCIMKVVEDVV